MMMKLAIQASERKLRCRPPRVVGVEAVTVMSTRRGRAWEGSETGERGQEVRELGSCVLHLRVFREGLCPMHKLLPIDRDRARRRRELSVATK